MQFIKNATLQSDLTNVKIKSVKFSLWKNGQHHLVKREQVNEDLKKRDFSSILSEFASLNNSNDPFFFQDFQASLMTRIF